MPPSDENPVESAPEADAPQSAPEPEADAPEADAPPAPAPAEPAKPKPRRVRQWLIGYAIVYALVFGLYFWTNSTRHDPTSPVAWLDEAFPGWENLPVRGAVQASSLTPVPPGMKLPQNACAPAVSDLVKLAEAVKEKDHPGGAPWNYLYPAERRLAEKFAFDPAEPGAGRVSLEEGQYIPLSPNAAVQPAALLAGALIRDLHAIARATPVGVEVTLQPIFIEEAFSLPEPNASRDFLVKAAEFMPPLPFMKRNFFLASLNWPGWLTYLNRAGFYLLIWLFLIDFVVTFLDRERLKTVTGLERARQAEDEAEKIRQRSELLDEEMRQVEARFLAIADIEGGAERQRILDMANRDMLLKRGELKHVVAAEVAAGKHYLTAEVGQAVVEEARRVLAQNVTAEDHDAAVEAFIERARQFGNSQ